MSKYELRSKYLIRKKPELSFYACWADRKGFLVDGFVFRNKKKPSRVPNRQPRSSEKRRTFKCFHGKLINHAWFHTRLSLNKGILGYVKGPTMYGIFWNWNVSFISLSTFGLRRMRMRIRRWRKMIENGI